MSAWRVMGIDYGLVRIGLALSDEQRTVATPLRTLSAGQGLMPRLFALLGEYSVGLVVVGRPWRSNGSPGTIDSRILHFSRVLQTRGIHVAFQDESGTSQAADLLTAPNQRHKRDGKRDRIAAAFLLQEFLDEREGLQDLDANASDFAEEIPA